MSTEREDGPTKHYRWVCDQCGKMSKRGVDEPPPLPPGWKKVGEDDWNGGIHNCPKCAKNPVAEPKEVVPNNGNGFQISDHDAVDRPLIRKDGNTLVIDLKEEGQLVITANTKIKVILKAEQG